MCQSIKKSETVISINLVEIRHFGMPINSKKNQFCEGNFGKFWQKLGKFSRANLSIDQTQKIMCHTIQRLLIQHYITLEFFYYIDINIDIDYTILYICFYLTFIYLIILDKMLKKRNG